MGILSGLALEAEGLERGDKISTLECPWCGVSGSFAVGVSDSGVVWYCCKRASCDRRGRLGGDKPQTNTNPQVKTLHPYTGPLLDEIPSNVHDEEFSKRGLSKRVLRDAGIRWSGDRVVIPIRDPYGTCVGHVLRAYGNIRGPKSLTFPASGEPQVGFYVKESRDTPLIIVEDYLSALVACVHGGVSSCFLNGVDLPLETASYIRKYGFSNVIIALDADATKKGNDLRNFVAPLFPKCRTMFLQQDIKDCENPQQLIEGFL